MIHLHHLSVATHLRFWNGYVHKKKMRQKTLYTYYSIESINSMRGLVIIVLIILIVCLCIHSLMPTDTYTYIVNDNTFEPYANTTVKDITEERVQNDINEIRKYQQLFGFSNKCKQGNADANQATTKTCQKPTADASWLNSTTQIKECFSELVPLLEATRCDVKNDSGRDDAENSEAEEKENKNKKQMDELKQNKQAQGLLKRDMGGMK